MSRASRKFLGRCSFFSCLQRHDKESNTNFGNGILIGLVFLKMSQSPVDIRRILRTHQGPSKQNNIYLLYSDAGHWVCSIFQDAFNSANRPMSKHRIAQFLLRTIKTKECHPWQGWAVGNTLNKFPDLTEPLANRAFNNDYNITNYHWNCVCVHEISDSSQISYLQL